MPVTITLSDAAAAELRGLLSVPSDVPSGAPSVPPPVAAIPHFVSAQEVAGRVKLITDAKWEKGEGSFYSSVALNDSNVWCICFMPTDTAAGNIATAEYQGVNTNRNWVLIRNRDSAVIARSVHAVQGPALSFNGTSSRLSPRIPLDVNERYTLSIWNAVPGINSRMVGQLYF